ncbi:restriction endonuclease [Pseudoalteromonas sp. SW0106-04]|uniref:nSTAND3 domain-containing NTPase n=1 Tax=Pseudoalteromonas sp. SW0106-04 TaxID=1702169 RepID=UPI0006B52F1B|nr:ATP-binding protein [Pseudoalteromonas sp. SW0106-04]
MLSNLSPVEFEDLCIDIASYKLGIRFSGFGPGPDGGIDGRYSKGPDNIIIQCKHYAGSNFSQLRASAKKEVEKLKSISPSRYLFFTSLSLTPMQQEELRTIFSEFVDSTDDIFGKTDIEGALRYYPEIEKSHIKLWLSSTAILERILHSGLENYSRATEDEILDAVRVYVHNPSYDEAAKKLEDEKVVVLSGSPGVGKTTLARMLAYSYLNEGWQLCSMTSLEDGFKKLDERSKTVYFFDDFLGRIELDKGALLKNETPLSTFVNQVRKSKNLRFILTTRAHIFEEAKQISDHLDSKRFQLARYLLDVGCYSRKIKAQILYNHLYVSNIGEEYIFELLKKDILGQIVDHRNYNPRIISHVCNEALFGEDAVEFPSFILAALDDPSLIWKKPYSNLALKQKNLLMALFFSNEFGIKLDALRDIFGLLHRKVSAHYLRSTSPADFEEALKTLESGFISISGDQVSFINPSLGDFLKSHLNNLELLLLLPDTAQSVRWLNKLWAHVRPLLSEQPSKFSTWFSECIKLLPLFVISPTSREDKTSTGTFIRSADLCASDRIVTLLDMWSDSRNEQFLEVALQVMASPNLEFSFWLDASTLFQTYINLKGWGENGHCLAELHRSLELKLVELIEKGCHIEELISFIETVNEYQGVEVPISIVSAIERSVDNELVYTNLNLYNLETESDLQEHIEFLEELGKITDRCPNRAIQEVENKLYEVESSYTEKSEVHFPKRNADDDFNDKQMKSLFSSLLKK